MSIQSSPARADGGYRGAEAARGTFRALQRFDLDATTRAQVALFTCGLGAACWWAWDLARGETAVTTACFLAPLVPLALALTVLIHRTVGARRELAIEGETLRAWSGWGAPEGWEPVAVPIADIEAAGVARFVPTRRVTRYRPARHHPRTGGLISFLALATTLASARTATVAGPVCYAVFVRRRGAPPQDARARVVLTHQLETPFDAEPLGRALALALGVPYEEHLGEEPPREEP